MTVSVQDPIKKYFGNGSAVSFTYPYLLLDQADLKVYLNGVLASGYTVTGIGNGGGGAVIFPSPPASGTLVILQRLVVLKRETDYQEAAAIPTGTLDRDFDRAWLAIQDTRAAAPLTLNGLGELDATTKRIINLADPINAQDAVTKAWAETSGTSQVVLATAQAVIAAAKASEATASSIAASASETSAENSATDANASKVAAGVSEAISVTSATSAATAAAQALTQAGLANASKLAAGTSETNAASFATNAHESELAAGASETNAHASELNAAASATAAAASAASIAGGPVASVAGLTGIVSATALKTATALNLVDNTPDAGKPVSAAMTTALNLKSNLAGAAFTGAVTISSAGSLIVSSKALTTPSSVTYGTTTTINAALSNVFYVAALTGNITTLTISNPTDGQTINIRFVQDGTGGRTVTLPSSVKAAGTLESAASRATWLILTYVSSASRWEGAYSGVPA